MQVQLIATQESQRSRDLRGGLPLAITPLHASSSKDPGSNPVPGWVVPRSRAAGGRPGLSGNVAPARRCSGSNFDQVGEGLRVWGCSLVCGLAAHQQPHRVGPSAWGCTSANKWNDQPWRTLTTLLRCGILLLSDPPVAEQRPGPGSRRGINVCHGGPVAGFKTSVNRHASGSKWTPPLAQRLPYG